VNGGSPSSSTGAEDRLEYELDAWSVDSRQLLRQLLVGDGVPHTWQGGVLTVPASEEERVDVLVDQVLATVAGTLADSSAPRVAFEVDDLDDGLVDNLLAALDDHGIGWVVAVDGTLEVTAGDADSVERLVEQLEFPHALPSSEVRDAPDGAGHAPGGDARSGGDDVGAVEIDPDRVLGGLFVAAGRLARSTTDPRAVLEVVELAGEVRDGDAPFGFDGVAWTRVQSASAELAGLLTDAAAVNDDDIEAAAVTLRDLLRPWV
jgi:hypothetical protein